MWHSSHYPPGFVQVNADASWVQPSLAANVSHFLASSSSLLPPDANHEFVWKGPEGAAKALKGDAESDDWSGMTFYVCTSPCYPHPTN